MSGSSSTRRHAAIAVGSIAIHIALFAAASALPEPAEPPDDASRYEPIEFVVYEPAAEASAVPASPPTPTPVAPTDTAIAEPTPATPTPIAEPSRSKPRAGDGAAPASTPTPTPPPAAAEPPPPPVAPDPKPAPGAIALQGVGHVNAPGTVTSPRLGASAIRELGDAPGAPQAPSGPAMPSRPGPSGGGSGGRGTDRVARTLEEAGFVRDKKGNYTYREPAGHFTAKLLPDGRVTFKDHIAKVTKGSVKMPDLYAVVTKSRKQNELWAKDKAELMRVTHELRLDIAVTFATHNIDTRLKAMYRELIDVWGAPDRTAIDRRKIIFERWDDCDERMRIKVAGFDDVDPSKIDELRLDAASRARTTVVEFVRKHLPKGSEDAYSADELAQLNRGRKSSEKFSPYEG